MNTIRGCVLAVLSSLSALTLVGCSGAPEPQGAGRGFGAVQLTSDAVVYCGSASFCSRPAVIAFDRVRDATPEWKTIRHDNVREGTAHYNLLRAEMHQRIVDKTKRAAKQNGCDLVVRAGDIADANGLEVMDLTDQVIRD